MTEPAAGGAGEPGEAEGGQGLRGVQWAQEWTRLGRRTVQRRASAWMAGDRSPYALRSTTRANTRRDRLIDPVDAERVRLQELGKLDPEINAERWAAMVAGRQEGIPWLSVTEEAWFQRALGSPPGS